MAFLLVGFGFLFCTSMTFAADAHFQWGVSTGEVDGYRIYWGDTQSGPYPNQLCEVNRTTTEYVATLDETIEYFLICRAFNSYGESGDSNEVCWDYNIPGIPSTFQRVVVEGKFKIQIISE